jgi:ribosome-associated toxin RatA of RatAB toxin-antitoxin module
MANRTITLLLVLLTLTLSSFSAERGAAPEGDSSTTQVTLTQLDAQDLYYIHGVFLSDSAPEEVWRVLSDYEGLKGILSGMQSSRVLERSGDKVLVEQVMVGQFLFFHKTLRLRLNIKEQAPWRIDFSSADASPFRHYEGSWEIDRTPTGCRVDYTLDVSRGDTAPQVLERQLFEQNSLALMRELRQDVQRRAGVPVVLGKVTPADGAGLP